MQNPAISIIVPVYNVKRYLPQCLDSVISQTYTNWECILVDDGSTDGSSVICDNYVNEDERFCVIHKVNGGVSSARNCGVDMAKGIFMTFLDADDYMTGTALEKLIEYGLHHNSDIVLGNTIKKYPNKEEIIHPTLTDNTWQYDYSCIIQSGLWGIIFKRQIIIDNNIRFQEGLAYSEDVLFKYMLLKHVKNVSSIGSLVYYYRINPFSAVASSDYRRKAYHQFLAAKSFEDYIKTIDNRKFKKTLLYAKNKIKRYGYNSVAHNHNPIVFYEIVKDYQSLYNGNRINLLEFLLWVFWYTIKLFMLNVYKRMKRAVINQFKQQYIY